MAKDLNKWWDAHYGSKSSGEQKLPRTLVPGSKSSQEQKFQEARRRERNATTSAHDNNIVNIHCSWYSQQHRTQSYNKSIADLNLSIFHHFNIRSPRSDDINYWLTTKSLMNYIHFGTRDRSVHHLLVHNLQVTTDDTAWSVQPTYKTQKCRVSTF